MSIDAETLSAEQRYFDIAWDARERKRQNLGRAHEAAAGNRRAVGEVSKNARELLARMGGPEEAVAFGRLDLEDDQVLYIGKDAISTEDRDLLVVGWQADAAVPYYKSTINDPLGVTRTRKFQTDKNEIRSFEDLIFADIAERLEELTDEQKVGVDDTLLRDLAAGRDGEMRDIVQTIHASQHDLICYPLERLLVVQGGPGTGKTAVALHRASWLLYHHRPDLTPDDFLVIGPSKTFTSYIKKVLPSLGDEGVAHGDLKALGPQRSDGRREPAFIARLKGDARMAGLIHRALHQRIRFPERQSELLVGQGESAARFTRDEVVTQLDKFRRLGTYNTGRQGFREWLGLEARRRSRSSSAWDAAAVDSAAERVWPSLTAQAFLQDLLGSRARLMQAAGDDFLAGDIDRLYRQAADKLANEKWSDTDVALLDEIDSLIRGRGPSYAHVIVDEAQDLSPMQLRSIARRSSSGSCTVVGDIAQSTGPWARDSWDDVVEALQQAHPSAVEELTLGYRVPRQLFDLAARLLPHAAPSVSAPRIVRDGPADPELLRSDSQDLVPCAADAAQKYAANGHFVGIVCSAEHHHAIAEELTDRGVNFVDAENGRLGSSINLMTAEQAKGLEFDALVVVEPEAIAKTDDTGLRHLYIALTRSTRLLTVVYSKSCAPLALYTHGPPQTPDTIGDSDLGEDVEIAHDAPRTETKAPPQSSTGSHSAAKPPGQGRLRAPVVDLMAKGLSEEIRILNKQTWPALLNAMREELGLTVDEVLEAMQTPGE